MPDDPVVPAVTPGVQTSEHAIAKSTDIMGTILTYLGMIVANAGLLTGIFGENTKIGIFIGAGVSVAGILVKLFNSLGYTAGRSSVKAAASAAVSTTSSILIALVVLLGLSGCNASQTATLDRIEADIKGSAAIVAQVLPAASAIMDAAVPGSSADKAVAKANIQVQKVNGVVQKVTITVPPTLAPVAPASTPPN